MKLNSTKANSVGKNQKNITNNYYSIKAQRKANNEGQGKPKLQDEHKQNEDLDWLEKLVHGFEWYNDKKNDLLNDKTQYNSQKKSKNTGNSLTKVQIDQNTQRYSQRKVLIDITKKNSQKNKQTNNEVNVKYVNFAKNLIKARRLQNQTSIVEKKNSRIIHFHRTKQIKQGKQTKQTKVLDTSDEELFKDQSENYEEKKESIQNQNDKDDLNKTQIYSIAQVLANEKYCKKGIKNSKADRKKFIGAVVQTKKSTGKIIKNKSIELKDLKQTIIQKQQKPKNQQNNKQQNGSYRISINKLKQQILNQQLNTEQCIVKQFNTEQSSKKLIQVQQKEIQQEISQKKCKAYQLQHAAETIKNELEFKKYKQYISSFEDDNKNQQRSAKKKQRKLNTSIGQRRIKAHSDFPIFPTTETLTNKAQCQRQQKIFSSVLINNKITKENIKEPHSKIDDKKQQDNKNVESEKLSGFGYHEVKYVESVKNSEIFTQEHSVVIDRPPFSNQIQVQNKEQKTKQEWNILQIFSKLDGRQLGILSANNCSIQSVTRQIRYILGTVLQQILHRDFKYNFNQFVCRVQQCLEDVRQFKPHVSAKSRQLSQLTENKNVFKNQRVDRNFHKKNYASNNQQILNAYDNYSKNIPLDNIAYKNENKQRLKKYDYSKSFGNQATQNIEEQQISQKKEKIVRFATFQDDEEGKDKQNSFVVPKSNQKVQLSLQQKIQRKLQMLNQFMPSMKYTSSIHINNKNELIPPANNRIGEKSRQNYHKQISKLQMLNNRLQKYLSNQSMKQYSTAKLLREQLL